MAAKFYSAVALLCLCTFANSFTLPNFTWGQNDSWLENLFSFDDPKCDNSTVKLAISKEGREHANATETNHHDSIARAYDTFDDFAQNPDPTSAPKSKVNNCNSTIGDCHLQRREEPEENLLNFTMESRHGGNYTDGDNGTVFIRRLRDAEEMANLTDSGNQTIARKRDFDDQSELETTTNIEKSRGGLSGPQIDETRTESSATDNGSLTYGYTNFIRDKRDSEEISNLTDGSTTKKFRNFDGSQINTSVTVNSYSANYSENFIGSNREPRDPDHANLTDYNETMTREHGGDPQSTRKPRKLSGSMVTTASPAGYKKRDSEQLGNFTADGDETADHANLTDYNETMTRKHGGDPQSTKKPRKLRGLEIDLTVTEPSVPANYSNVYSLDSVRYRRDADHANLTDYNETMTRKHGGDPQSTRKPRKFSDSMVTKSTTASPVPAGYKKRDSEQLGNFTKDGNETAARNYADDIPKTTTIKMYRGFHGAEIPENKYNYTGQQDSSASIPALVDSMEKVNSTEDAGARNYGDPGTITTTKKYRVLYGPAIDHTRTEATTLGTSGPTTKGQPDVVPNTTVHELVRRDLDSPSNYTGSTNSSSGGLYGYYNSEDSDFTSKGVDSIDDKGGLDHLGHKSNQTHDSMSPVGVFAAPEGKSITVNSTNSSTGSRMRRDFDNELDDVDEDSHGDSEDDEKEPKTVVFVGIFETNLGNSTGNGNKTGAGRTGSARQSGYSPTPKKPSTTTKKYRRLDLDDTSTEKDTTTDQRACTENPTIHLIHLESIGSRIRRFETPSNYTNGTDSRGHEYLGRDFESLGNFTNSSNDSTLVRRDISNNTSLFSESPDTAAEVHGLKLTDKNDSTSGRTLDFVGNYTINGTAGGRAAIGRGPVSRVADDLRKSQGLNYYMGDSYPWVNCPGCGLVQRTRIVGGRQASIREFPWMVAIRKNGVQHCGGSILNNFYILTAAHCLNGHDTKTFTVVASVTDVMDQRAFKSKVEYGVFNERFDPETYDYDVALLKLTKRIPLGDGVTPVCLPVSPADWTGQVGVVSGWGAVIETATVAPEALRKVGLPIVANEECQKAEGLKGQKITERMMCAGYVKGSMDACAGDSGGPMVCYSKGIYEQVGIVSWGIGCARPKYFGVYTRVTTMLDWISQHIPKDSC